MSVILFAASFVYTCTTHRSKLFLFHLEIIKRLWEKAARRKKSACFYLLKGVSAEE